MTIYTIILCEMLTLLGEISIFLWTLIHKNLKCFIVPHICATLWNKVFVVVHGNDSLPVINGQNIRKCELVNSQYILQILL